MTPQELRESIIYLAMQGKLTEQRDSDGNSKELLRSYLGEKYDEPNEIPFAIPQNWTWVLFSSIANFKIGKTPARAESKYWAADKPWVSIADMTPYGRIRSTKEQISALAAKEFFNGNISPVGTLIMSFKLTVGRVSILDVDAYHNEAIISVYPKLGNDNVFRDYLFYLLPTVSMFGRTKSAIKGMTLNKDSISSLPIPLPPLAEQKRIIEKITMLMPLVDEYELVYNKLKALNDSVADNLEKSVLQFALQGRLVPQLPEEGVGQVLFDSIKTERKKFFESGKVKRGKEHQPVSNDDIPFDIPSSWAWARVGDVFQHNTGKALNSSDNKGTLLEYITTSNVYWNRFELGKLKKMYFTEDEIEKCSVKPGDLLVLEGGDFGRSAIWQSESSVCIQNHIHRLRPYLPVNVKFFYYVFLLYKGIGIIKGKGIGIQGLSANALGSLVVPLPPVEEQNRIVAKIDELMLLIESLKPEEKDV